MKNLKVYLIISICFNVLLGYIILKPAPKVSNMETYLLDRISKDNKAKKESILRDSLRYESHIKELKNKIYYVQKKRKDEHDLYEQQLTKINNLSNDSSYYSYIDSIKKLCCSSNSR